LKNNSTVNAEVSVSDVTVINALLKHLLIPVSYER